MFSPSCAIVLVIAASGNGYGKPAFYPAAYEGVFAVGSFTQMDQVAPYSNSAPIYAPGGFIPAKSDTDTGKLTGCERLKIPQGNEPDPRLVGGIFQTVTLRINNDRESRLMVCQGTSQATGFVTGVASAVKSIFKVKDIRSPKAVFQVILESARSVDGKQVLDADNAIQLAQLLTTPRTQLSKSEQASVDAFAKRLKKRGDVLLEDGEKSLRTSRIKAAFIIYTDVDKLSTDIKVSDWDWNTICWDGGLIGGINKEKEFVIDIMPACEEAVKLGKLTSLRNYYQAIDSRGIAKALVGKFDEAANDFKNASDSGYLSRGTEERRKEWISTLSKSRNPFTRSVLEELLRDPQESGG
jgi:Subtilase family